MMKKLVYFSILIIGLVLGACSKKWDDHYNLDSSANDSSVVSSLNLLDYLKTQPQYSKFVEVLEKTNVAQELSRDQFLTVWALNNDAMKSLDAIGSTLETKGMTDTFIMKYHVNNLAFSLSKLKDGLRLKTLNNKYLSVNVGTDGIINLATNAQLVKPNQFCKNGVVNEVSKLMIPKKSIYEYLQGLGEDYSIIRDSILAGNVKIFDAANSTPLSVDQTGNTLYDSVFVVKNPIWNAVDFNSEFSQVTMFLPNNQVIQDCFANLKSQYANIGKPFGKSDSTLAFNWIKQAIFYNSIISDYGSTLDLTSAYKKIWRTSVQQINTTPHVMSNGLIYDVNYLKIPNNVYITRIKSLIHYYEYLLDDQKSTYYTFYNTSASGGIQIKIADSYTWPTIPVSGVYTILYLKGDNPKDVKKLAVEFSPVKLIQKLDGTTSATGMTVPPGEYNLYLGVLAKNHPYINVYFNGAQVASGLNVEPATPWNYDRANQCVPGTKYDGLGGLVGKVTIPGDKPTSFRLKIEFERLGKGTLEELKLYHWALVPTANNY